MRTEIYTLKVSSSRWEKEKANDASPNLNDIVTILDSRGMHWFESRVNTAYLPQNNNNLFTSRINVSPNYADYEFSSSNIYKNGL